MMNTELLPKNFFRDNTLDEMSVPLFAQFFMTAYFDDKVHNAISESLEGIMDPERKAKIKEEQEKISRLETGEEVVKFIRGDYDVLNQTLLCKKALTMQAEVMAPSPSKDVVYE